MRLAGLAVALLVAAFLAVAGWSAHFGVHVAPSKLDLLALRAQRLGAETATLKAHLRAQLADDERRLQQDDLTADQQQALRDQISAERALLDAP